MTEPSSPGGRAKIVRKDSGKTQAEMAEFLGLAIGTWQKLERDEVVPSGETLLSFERLGINPGWVLSGLGPKLLKEDDSYLYAKNAIIDGDLLLDIKTIVATVNREEGITFPQETLDRQAIEFYNEYMISDTDLSDVDEMQAWLRWLEKRVRRAAKSASSEPGTGKRSA